MAVTVNTSSGDGHILEVFTEWIGEPMMSL